MGLNGKKLPFIFFHKTKHMTIAPIEFASPDYDRTVRLRTEVLREPIGLDFSVEQLAAEWADHHIGCFDENEEIVGCLILSKKNEKTVKMRQVAVSPAHQKMGIGQKMVAWSEVWAQRNGYKKMSLNARETAVPFYEKLGYPCIGERFLEVGIGHFLMEKNL